MRVALSSGARLGTGFIPRKFTEALTAVGQTAMLVLATWHDFVIVIGPRRAGAPTVNRHEVRAHPPVSARLWQARTGGSIADQLLRTQPFGGSL
jgi:hypothetical protein